MILQPEAERIEEERQEAAREDFARIEERITYLERTLLIPDVDQMRQTIPPEQIDRVAESLRQRGMLQPLRVTLAETLGMYRIRTGHIRYFASAPDKADLKKLPCIICDGSASELDLAIDQFTENAVRLDFNPVEYGLGYRRIAQMSGMNGAKLAKQLGVSQAEVSISQTLLENPPEILADIADGTIGKMVGYYLATCKDAEMRRVLWQKARRKEVTKEEVKEEVAASNNGGKPSKPKGRKLKAVATHKSGITFPIDFKRPLAETKAAAAWFDRFLRDCKSLEELKEKVGFEGEIPQSPTSDAQPEAEPETPEGGGA